MTLYRTISIDPPWKLTGGGQSKRGSDAHYPLLSTSEIMALLQSHRMLTPDPSGCHLYVWVTNNFLEDGLRVMKALGFRYVTNLAWVKNHYGLGRYFRGQHELALFGVMGDTQMPDVHDISSVISADKREHSEKPDLFYEIVEKVSQPPRLELFARAPRKGWDTWGNEIDGAMATHGLDAPW